MTEKRDFLERIKTLRLRANGIERLVLELRPVPVEQPEEALA